jgi:peroxiredoxin
MEGFRKMGIQVIAASADTLKHAREMVQKNNLSFPVGYGFNAKEFSAKTGAFYEAKDEYLHATGFVLNPESRVINAVYSTMAIGRLVAKDCIGLIEHLTKK